LENSIHDLLPFLSPLRHHPFQQLQLLGNPGQPLFFVFGQFVVDADVSQQFHKIRMRCQFLQQK